MAPQRKVEFVILKLEFLPNMHPEYPRITLNRKRHSPGGSMAQATEWFNHAMSIEISKIPPNLYVRYSQWNITSGNASLFTVNGCRFDKIILILGEEFVHWVYYQNMPFRRRIEGFGRLSISYCGCCLNNQYLKIIDTIKSCIMKKGSCYY